MGDFKGNWLDWNSDITLATFWKEHFGGKYAGCKGIFNVEKKMPNPILVNGAFSNFYVYICTCMGFFLLLLSFGFISLL